MNTYPPTQKPAELAESRLIEAILDGTFPFESSLPPERELAARLGVTRPTLREALQRLGRDGWIQIHQGKATHVCNPWHDGNLAVLIHLAEHANHHYPEFVEHLLSVRCLLTPAYCKAAIENAQDRTVSLFEQHPAIDASPEDFAEYDWRMHRELSILSGNPVFTLILNGFTSMYLVLAKRYFENSQAREHSFAFYLALYQAAVNGNSQQAYSVCQDVMQESIVFWQSINP